MKRFILIIGCCIFLINTISASSKNSIDTDVDFFLGMKLLNNKKYDKANYFFNKVIDKNTQFDRRAFKAQMYSALINIKVRKFSFVVNCIPTYELLEGYFNSHYNDYLHFIIAMGLYNKAVENAKILIFFNREIYSAKLIKKALVELSHINAETFFLKDFLKLKGKLEEKKKKYTLYLIKYFMIRESYFSAINRVNLSAINLNNKNDAKLMLVVYKLYNEMLLDKYMNYFIERFQDIDDGYQFGDTFVVPNKLDINIRFFDKFN
ncbi:MAG TPA: hypothetical protein V7792_00425 [Candidatus Azoamicus sp. OHIO2]